MKHVVNISGGLSSWEAARRVKAKHGTESMVLLFADTNMEDEDLYRFLNDVENNIGIPITRISDGRTPWQVFKDVRFLGNSRIDPCSKILKRELLNKWHKDNCKVEDTVIYVGLGWTEEHRLIKFRNRMQPWKVEAPLMEPPYLEPKQLQQIALDNDIEVPRLYKLGFPHNNCGGFCVKAGQAQFKLLLQTKPELYAIHENNEQDLQEYLGKNVTILRETISGKRNNLSLKTLRERVESNQKIDEYDWGGCGCAI